MKFRIQCCFASGHIIYESKAKGNQIRMSYATFRISHIVYRMSRPSARRNLTSIHYIQRLSEQNVTYNSGKNRKKSENHDKFGKKTLFSGRICKFFTGFFSFISLIRVNFIRFLIFLRGSSHSTGSGQARPS